MGDRFRLDRGSLWTAVIAALAWLLSGALNAALTTVALTLLAAPYAGTLRHSVRIDLDIVDAGPWQ